MRTIGIIQPSFLPWRGYFDFIREVDAFVFLDDVQYTKNDWRNRNRIRSPEGRSEWLTVPVRRTSKVLILEAETDETRDWRRRHLDKLRHNYAKAPHMDAVLELLASEYEKGETRLSVLTVSLTKRILTVLGIRTELHLSSEIPSAGRKDEKLIQITRYLGGTRYLSGPSAKAYLKQELWREAGIELAFKQYQGYPDYPQVAAPFDPFVSIIDLLCMTGPEAHRYLIRRDRGQDKRHA